MAVLLHRISWSVQMSARRAAERDEGKICQVAEGDLADHKKHGGGPERLALIKQDIGRLTALVRTRLRRMR